MTDQRSSGFSAQRTYLTTAVLAATITGVANVVAMNLQHIFPKDDPAEQPAASDGTPSAHYADDAGLQEGPSAFGRWDGREKDRDYRAESDGFVAAYTGGRDPADEFVVEVGELDTDSGAISWDVRTRAGRYDGTVCPVSKGDYWRVRSFGGGRIVIHWLPISVIVD